MIQLKYTLPILLSVWLLPWFHWCCFSGFLTISYHFVWCFLMFLQFPLCASPISYGRFCDFHYWECWLWQKGFISVIDKTFSYWNSNAEKPQVLSLTPTVYTYWIVSINIDNTTIHSALQVPVNYFQENLPSLNNKTGSMLAIPFEIKSFLHEVILLRARGFFKWYLFLTATSFFIAAFQC